MPTNLQQAQASYADRGGDNALAVMVQEHNDRSHKYLPDQLAEIAKDGLKPTTTMWAAYHVPSDDWFVGSEEPPGVTVAVSVELPMGMTSEKCMELTKELRDKVYAQVDR